MVLPKRAITTTMRAWASPAPSLRGLHGGLRRGREGQGPSPRPPALRVVGRVGDTLVCYSFNLFSRIRRASHRASGGGAGMGEARRNRPPCITNKKRSCGAVCAVVFPMMSLSPAVPNQVLQVQSIRSGGERNRSAVSAHGKQDPISGWLRWRHYSSPGAAGSYWPGQPSVCRALRFPMTLARPPWPVRTGPQAAHS